MSDRGFLLDVNVLLALLWPTHQFHDLVRTWFREHGNRRWATCPLTQNGFVRLASNPAITRDALTISESLLLLKTNLAHPGHSFWADDLDLAGALARSNARLQGYRQLTDAYLLGLAIHHKGQVVTLDGGLATLLPPAVRDTDWILDLSTARRRR
ncbi:MAG TPA: TA system VapC family ribonuclease toxin [Acidobacteriaceae bacterium]|jgi:toxin-antitoxin system PIN domain toxin|nr:TA system VapC family ribonuclease toxin [Acidobacteriaceae bacterium]